MITTPVICYLATRIFNWGSWTYQKGGKNIFADFGDLALIDLLPGTLALFLPFLFVSLLQVQRQASYLNLAQILKPFQSNYQAINASSMSPP